MSAYRLSPVSWHRASVSSGGLSTDVRVYQPRQDPLERAGPGWLVWAHGGSWHGGSTADWHPALAHLAALSGATVVGVDYRLAPGHPHPAPLLDVLAVLAWAELHAEGAPLAVGGDSAGATLAASAALVRRDRQLPLAAQVLAYPPIDPECVAPSYRGESPSFPDPFTLAAAWRGYRGGGVARHLPRGSYYSTPAEAADVRGVAPAVLAVGDLDPVRDDVHAYARRLTNAGVPVSAHSHPRTVHGAFLGSPAFRRDLAAAYVHLVDSTTRATAPARQEQP